MEQDMNSEFQLKTLVQILVQTRIFPYKMILQSTNGQAENYIFFLTECQHVLKTLHLLGEKCKLNGIK